LVNERPPERVEGGTLGVFFGARRGTGGGLDPRAMFWAISGKIAEMVDRPEVGGSV
jgi:hypothetical protein